MLYIHFEINVAVKETSIKLKHNLLTPLQYWSICFIFSAKVYSVFLELVEIP